MKSPVGQERHPVVPVCKRFMRSAGAVFVSIGALTVLAACQETRVVEVQVPVEAPKCELHRFDEGRKFVVEAWAVPNSEFDVGEPLRFQMRASASSYMNIFYVSTSCKVTRLLHNHRVKAAEIVAFPLDTSGLQMIVKPPAGEEGFYFVATREALDFLAGADVLREAAGIASLDLSPKQFYERLAEARSRINPDDWSITTLRTTVVGR